MASVLCGRLSSCRHLRRFYNTGNHLPTQTNSTWKRTLCLSVPGLALLGGGTLWLFNRYNKNEKLSLVSAVYAAKPERSTKIQREETAASGASLSRLTSRERRFVQFASIEYRGQLYMTPQDFLESVIEAEPRPRLKRRVLSEDDISAVRKNTPSLKKGSPRTFRDLRDQGIISYTEYLFLLSILTKPKSGFNIAFNMFDTDGNCRVDKEEFLVLLGILCQRVFKEDILRGVDPALLEKIFSHAYRDRRGQSADREAGLQRRNEIDTTLLVHLFGAKGKHQLKYEEFAKFMERLQMEVLELEFLEFSKGLATITELDFAKILLRYTQLDPEEYDLFLERLMEADYEEKGITFTDFYDFCQFLNSLDDFAIAMRMYSLANRPITKDEFQRAVKICTGAALSPHVVHTVFLLFDEDGDGRLSDKEFIDIMRDRIHRGLKSYTRNEGWDAFKSCIKQELKSSF